MPMLNQVIAICDGTKNRSKDKLTKSHHALQKPDMFSGHTKTYRPRNDDPTQATGEQLPPENKKVVANAEEIIKETAAAKVEEFEVMYMRDAANCLARANVVVDGNVILKDVPVTFLLYLEHQIEDLVTFVKKLPTLDPTEHWKYDEAQACYRTDPVDTTRTKKVFKPLELAPATKEHPAQVKEGYEDITAGFWSTIKYSTALPVKRVNEMLSRVEKLQQAVKFAREEANKIDAPASPKPGASVFGYLFG